MLNSDNQVQKSRPKISFKSVYGKLREGMPLSSDDPDKQTICSYFKRSISNMSYYTSRLRKAGLIYYKGHGVWEVLRDYDEESLKRVQKIRQVTNDNMPEYLKSMNENDSRGHAFVTSLKLPKGLLNWDKRPEGLKKLEIDFYPLKNQGGGQGIIFRGKKVHLKNNSIVIYDKENYVGEFAKETNEYALFKTLQFIKALERFLQANFKIDDKYIFKVCKKHFSLVKNSLAKQITDRGIKMNMEIKGEWFKVDNSFDSPELEFRGSSAVSDSDGMRMQFDSHKATNYQVTAEFVLERFKETQDQIIAVVQNQNYHAENLKTHIGTMQKIGVGVETLTNKLDLFIQIANNLQIIVERALNQKS
jgi:hypothetical protein